MLGYLCVCCLCVLSIPLVTRAWHVGNPRHVTCRVYIDMHPSVCILYSCYVNCTIWVLIWFEYFALMCLWVYLVMWSVLLCGLFQSCGLIFCQSQIFLIFQMVSIFSSYDVFASLFLSFQSVSASTECHECLWIWGGIPRIFLFCELLKQRCKCFATRLVVFDVPCVSL
jgi:hypothetical protein